jgi:hypothetical protein
MVTFLQNLCTWISHQAMLASNVVYPTHKNIGVVMNISMPQSHILRFLILLSIGSALCLQGLTAMQQRTLAQTACAEVRNGKIFKDCLKSHQNTIAQRSWPDPAEGAVVVARQPIADSFDWINKVIPEMLRVRLRQIAKIWDPEEFAAIKNAADKTGLDFITYLRNVNAIMSAGRNLNLEMLKAIRPYLQDTDMNNALFHAADTPDKEKKEHQYFVIVYLLKPMTVKGGQTYACANKDTVMKQSSDDQKKRIQAVYDIAINVGNVSRSELAYAQQTTPKLRTEVIQTIDSLSSVIDRVTKENLLAIPRDIMEKVTHWKKLRAEYASRASAVSAAPAIPTTEAQIIEAINNLTADSDDKAQQAIVDAIKNFSDESKSANFGNALLNKLEPIKNTTFAKSLHKKFLQNAETSTACSIIAAQIEQLTQPSKEQEAPVPKPQIIIRVDIDFPAQSWDIDALKQLGSLSQGEKNYALANAATRQATTESEIQKQEVFFAYIIGQGANLDRTISAAAGTAKSRLQEYKKKISPPAVAQPTEQQQQLERRIRTMIADCGMFLTAKASQPAPGDIVETIATIKDLAKRQELFTELTKVISSVSDKKVSSTEYDTGALQTKLDTAVDKIKKEPPSPLPAPLPAPQPTATTITSSSPTPAAPTTGPLSPPSISVPAPLLPQQPVAVLATPDPIITAIEKLTANSDETVQQRLVDTIKNIASVPTITLLGTALFKKLQTIGDIPFTESLHAKFKEAENNLACSAIANRIEPLLKEKIKSKSGTAAAPTETPPTLKHIMQSINALTADTSDAELDALITLIDRYPDASDLLEVKVVHPLVTKIRACKLSKLLEKMHDYAVKHPTSYSVGLLAANLDTALPPESAKAQPKKEKTQRPQEAPQPVALQPSQVPTQEELARLSKDQAIVQLEAAAKVDKLEAFNNALPAALGLPLEATDEEVAQKITTTLKNEKSAIDIAARYCAHTILQYLFGKQEYKLTQKTDVCKKALWYAVTYYDEDETIVARAKPTVTYLLSLPGNLEYAETIRQNISEDPPGRAQWFATIVDEYRKQHPADEPASLPAPTSAAPTTGPLLPLFPRFGPAATKATRPKTLPKEKFVSCPICQAQNAPTSKECMRCSAPLIITQSQVSPAPQPQAVQGRKLDPQEKLRKEQENLRQEVSNTIGLCAEYLLNPSDVASAEVTPIDVVHMIAQVSDKTLRTTFFDKLMDQIEAAKKSLQASSIPARVDLDKDRLQTKLNELVKKNFPEQATR